MAIADVKEFAHLTQADVEALGHEFDAIRADIEESRGDSDAAYIRRLITVQRRLNVAARVAMFGSHRRELWWAGAALLSVAKILENMEIGHNVMHGEWDWMNDPEIHSSTWEWDNVCPSDQWKHSHNYLHHTYTNVIGKDKDVGYEILRVRSDQPWHPYYLTQPVVNTLLMLAFEYGVSLHDLDIEGLRKQQLEDPQEFKRKLAAIARKQARQAGKDYVLFPLLTGPNARNTASANFVANVVRNVWSYAIIFCGHFPDGAEVFTRGGAGERDPGRVVPAAAPRVGELHRGPADARHVRQPGLPDRAPPLPRSVLEPLPGDRGPRPGAVREVRAPLHHRPVPAAVLADHPVHLATVAAGQEDARGLAASSGPRAPASLGRGEPDGRGVGGHAADGTGAHVDAGDGVRRLLTRPEHPRSPVRLNLRQAGGRGCPYRRVMVDDDSRGTQGPPGTAADHGSRSLKTAASVLRALRLLGGHPQGLSCQDVGRLLGKSSATARYMINTLCEGGFAERRHDGRWYLADTPPWGTAWDPYEGSDEPAGSTAPGFEGEGAAQAVLSEAVTELYRRTRQRSYLVRRSGVVVATVSDARGHQGLARLPGLGDHVPPRHAHALAMTKILLGASPTYLEAVESEPLEALTDRTPTRLADLRRQLEEIRRRGHAIDDGEFADGFVTLAAPIRSPGGGVTVALGLSTSARRYGTDAEELVTAVVETAAEAGRQWVAHVGSRPSLAGRAHAPGRSGRGGSAAHVLESEGP